MKKARLKTAIVLVIGGSLGYIAACSNQQPERDANAAAQQADTPKNATSNTNTGDQLAQTVGIVTIFAQKLIGR